MDAFRQGLRDFGHVEGQNIALEIRWTEGRFERLPELAAELVRWKPNVLVTAGPYGLQAARRATTTIPIGMISCDPAEIIVERIARPSGHIPGVTCMSSDLTPKRLQLLKETVPSIQRVAVLYNPSDPNKAEEVRLMQAPARALGITLLSVEAEEAGAFERAVADAGRERADALFVLPDPLTRRRLECPRTPLRFEQRPKNSYASSTTWTGSVSWRAGHRIRRRSSPGTMSGWMVVQLC